MAKDKMRFIKQTIANMSIEQKVGQCLVIGFVGDVITPEIIKRIKNYYPSGIRAGLTFRIKTAIHDRTPPVPYSPTGHSRAKGTVKTSSPASRPRMSPTPNTASSSTP